ncbi:MAG: PQQ-like beta-propeller repeat protein [Gemmatimonadetes bacterium]|nr:PQQ-like beta-propeller repeat protein [Gemmatimonadota bacterium]
MAYDEYPSASSVGQRVPAIGDDGTLYVPADALYAINPDGTRKWRFPTSWGPQGMPVIGPDGTIYITGGQDNLWAVNPDGTQKWLFKLVVGSEMSFGSPAIDADGTIYVPAEDGDKGYLYAINPDGQQRWRYAVQGAGRALRSSPAIAPDGTIYVGTKFGDPAAQMLALNPDGTIKWTLDVEPVVGADDIYCSPTIGADGTIYFGAETGFFYAVDAAGNLKWSIKLNGGNVWSSPALLDDGTLYFGNVGLSWEGEWYGYLFAVQTNSPGLAASPWPKFRRNNRNTGR